MKSMGLIRMVWFVRSLEIFSTIKEEKEKELKDIIYDTYSKGDLIYLFDDQLINKKNFKTEITATQQKGSKEYLY